MNGKQYKTIYASPIGEILLCSDGEALTGLHICGQTGFECARNSDGEFLRDMPIFKEAVRWLDIYFAGKCPDFTPLLCLNGTAFQKEVWALLLKIPYGQTVTYGALAAEIAHRRGIKRMSAQAVGGVVGANPVSIIVPCHRVVGADGSLVGYNGGIDKKIRLLTLEKAFVRNIDLPHEKYYNKGD